MTTEKGIETILNYTVISMHIIVWGVVIMLVILLGHVAMKLAHLLRKNKGQ